jgi:flagellar motor switch protein FliG
MELAKHLRNVSARIRARLAATDRRSRMVALALAGLALGGVVWLAVGQRSDKWVGAGEIPDAAARAAAVERLDKQGIPCRLDGAAIQVRGSDLSRAKAVIGAARPADDLAGLTEQQDLWTTESQRAQRRQGQKMAALGRLIGQYPAVKSAVVLLEAGTSRALGAAATSPTAAVNLTMVEGAEMTRELALKIARLVSGCVVSMRCEDVRIIDSCGPSVRVDESGQPVGVDSAVRVRWARAEAVQVVQSSLAHVGDVRVRAGVLPGETPKVTGLWVSVPESCLSGAGATTDAAAAEVLAGVRRTAAKAVGLTEADVAASCHRDAAPAKASVRARPGGQRPEAVLWTLLAAMGVAAGSGGVIVVRRMRARRSAAAQAAPATAAQSPQARLAELLERIPCDELLMVVRDEHPQTLAVMFTHMDAARAASVLGGLDEEAQVAVARRLAELESIDPEVKAELEVALAARLTGVLQRASVAGGPGRLAAILRHAGLATEQAVMDRLADESPALAESLRGRMFTFEDILAVCDVRLAEALDGLPLDEVAVALRTASKELTGKMIGCLPATVAGQLRREMANVGPVRISDVEAAQERIVRAVQYAAEKAPVPVATTEKANGKSH